MKLDEAIQKTKEEWENNPQLLQDRDNVISKYGEMFKLENIDNLTQEKFQEFLRFENNKHWSRLDRPGGNLVKDMSKLKNALKILLDESVPLTDRIKRVRDKSSNDYTPFLANAIYTPILLVTNPQKYPIVNLPVAEALDELGLYSIRKWKSGEDEWDSVPQMQKIIHDMAAKYNFDLWQIDWVWWKIARDKNLIDNDADDQLLEYVEKMSMQANFKPIVIKTLLEKGPKENFTATLDEVKEKIKLLNFGREDFEINQAVKSVSEALKEFVTFENNVTPKNLDIFESTDVSKCLKICGQKIAQWHIDEITKSNYEMWNIKPGSRDEDFMYLDEFLKTNSIGVGWDKVRDISNLSESEVKQKFEEHYDKGWSGFQNFMKTKPKDIVVLTKGQEKIIDFGIVVSDYEFRDTKDPSYPHRKNVVWLNRGEILAKELPNPTLHGMIATCGKLVERKQEFMDVLLENQNLTSIKNYFIITSYPDSKYDDIEGEQYHFPSHIPNAKEFVEGTNFIVQTKIDKKNYFVGYGKVGKIEDFDDTNENGKAITMCKAKFSQYTKFNEPKLRTDEINDKMLWIAFPNKGKGSPPPSMLKIELPLYQEIMGEDLIKTDIVSDTLNLDPYIEALKWKPNLILYGPPGTGKTFHANEIANKIIHNQESKIAICWPTDKDESKVEDFARVIEENGKVLWGVNWGVDQVNSSDFPIAGYVYYKQNIIAIAKISDCTSHEETEESDLKLRPQKWHNGQDYKNYLHFTNIHRCKPFPHKKLKLNDPSKQIPDIIQQRVYVKQLSDFLRKVTFHPSYSYEDFVEGFRPNVNDSGKQPYVLENGIFKLICQSAKNDPDNVYVLLIDEINRGNIPKILGELITLIEEDKRNEKYALTLAYSKEDFFVPENLRIIATMNTADKSLMQMDDALKRRFVFEELMPDTNSLLEHLKKEGVVNAEDYKKILDKINDKILGKGEEDSEQKMKQFRDRQIGHSYFWKIKDDENLQSVIKYDIIPLLQDYFYGDYNEIRKILGDKIISEDNRPTNLITDKSKANELKAELLKI